MAMLGDVIYDKLSRPKFGLGKVDRTCAPVAILAHRLRARRSFGSSYDYIAVLQFLGGTLLPEVRRRVLLCGPSCH